MTGEKFTLMQYSVHAILGLIDAEDFVIPEIQRPFVWKRSQVRDLIDSLYNGYPTGYIITWKNPDVKTKDGGKANGKKVLIDGQQRVTALMAAISGREVLDDDFNKERIRERINNKLHRTTVPSVRNKLIDTNTPNIAGNIGLQKWANKENLKIVSAEYNKMLTHNLHNFSELEDRIALLHMQQKEVNTSVVSLESQIRHLREMLKYAEQYQKNKIYDDHYKSSKDPDRYFRKYESQIILFAGAEHILQENGMDLKHLNTNKLQEQLSDLISQKKSLNTQYVSFKQEIKELELIHQNLSKYLKQNAPKIQRFSHNKLPSL